MFMRSFIAIVSLFVASAAFAQDFELKIWDGVKMPQKATASAEKKGGQYGADNESFQAVAEPTIRAYKAASDKPTAAILICPGGGYMHLAYGKEGTKIAKFLQEAGVTCFVLKYRIPGSRDSAFADAQRAIRLIRKNAKEWNVAPNRIGIMGFSAGAHLSARTSTNYDTDAYEPIDAADKLSAKPNFTVLIYPAYLADKETLALSKEIRVNKDTPPAFIVQTLDDDAYEASSVGYFLAMRREGLKVDFHMFGKGGHGYGLNLKNEPVADWGKLLKRWLEFNGFAK